MDKGDAQPIQIGELVLYEGYIRRVEGIEKGREATRLRLEGLPYQLISVQEVQRARRRRQAWKSDLDSPR